MAMYTTDVVNSGIDTGCLAAMTCLRNIELQMRHDFTMLQLTPFGDGLAGTASGELLLEMDSATTPRCSSLISVLESRWHDFRLALANILCMSDGMDEQGIAGMATSLVIEFEEDARGHEDEAIFMQSTFEQYGIEDPSGPWAGPRELVNCPPLQKLQLCKCSVQPLVFLDLACLQLRA